MAEFIQRNGAAVLLMGGLFLYGARLAPLLAATAVSIVLFHSLIAHKEISFVYPALPCAIVVIGLGAARLVERVPSMMRYPVTPDRAFVIAIALCLAVAMTVAASERPYEATPRQRAMFTLFGYAQAQPDLCGLGLYGRNDFPWADTLGYTGLRRDVPLYLLSWPAEFEQGKDGFNYAIGLEKLAGDMPGFEPFRCAYGYCLYHRPTQCRFQPELEISHQLLRTEQ